MMNRRGFIGGIISVMAAPVLPYIDKNTRVSLGQMGSLGYRPATSIRFVSGRIQKMRGWQKPLRSLAMGETVLVDHQIS